MRDSVCLNGFWDFAVSDAKQPPVLPTVYDDAKILVPCPFDINGFLPLETRRIDDEEVLLKGMESNLFPEYDEKWERAKAGFYRRDFFVPADWADRKVTLKFGAVLFYSECYVNGRLVHTDCDGFTPFEFVINHHIRFGADNEIIVYAKNADQFAYMDDGHKRIEYPKGSFWGEKVTGIWQDVFLNSYPLTHVSDVYVITDIFESRLRAQVTLDGDLPADGALRFTLREYGGEKSRDLGRCPVTGAVTDFAWDYAAFADEIRLWDMGQPNLYYLDVALLAADGQPLDEATTRFGFRAVETRGKRIWLNGRPIVLKQDSWHYLGFVYQNEEYARKWFQMERDVNVNNIRLHAQPYPSFFLDIADEMGMMIVGESAIWGSHCQFHNSDKFIENCKRHLERMVKRDRNHPSVILWSIENECLRAYGVSRDDAVKNVEELAQKLAPLGDFVRSLDNTRVMSAEGSRDLGGSMDIYSLHYTGLTSPETDLPVTMGEMGSMYYSTPSSANEYLGEDAFYSQDNRWENLGQEAFYTLKYQRKWAAGVCVFNVIWYGLQPLPIKERLLTYDDYTAPGVKIRKIGEYMSTINAGYDPDLPDYIPNPLFKWVKKGFAPERTFFEGERRAFYAGETAAIKISVHNDCGSQKTYTVTATLFDGDATVLTADRQVTVGACDYTLTDVTFPAPAVDGVKSYRLALELSDGQTVVCTDETTVKIFDKEALRAGLPAGVIGVAGVDGCRFDGFAPIAQYEQGKYAAVIVGDGVSDELYERILKGAAPVLDLTGRHPLLEGKAPNKNIRKGFFTTAAADVGEHLSDGDLMGMTGDLFASRFIDGDVSENTVPLIVSGNGETVALELPQGRHNTVICSSPITDFDHPVALQLTLNIVRRLLGTARSYAPALVVAGEDSPLVACLRGLNAAFERISPEDKTALKSIRGADVLLADGSGDLGYLNELTADNARRVHIFALENQNIPKHMRGFFEVLDKKCYQFRLLENSPLTDTVLASDLYGNDHRIPLTTRPIRILDAGKCVPVAVTTDVDWRAWNDIAEYRKTITIKRTELAPHEHLALLCRLPFNGIEVTVDQLDIVRDFHKIKFTLRKLLTNLGIRLGGREANETVRVYDQKVIRNRMVNVATGDSAVVDHAAGEVIPAGTYDQIIWVLSPQDRTDLLRNPDLIYMTYSAPFETELLVNDKPMTAGRVIDLNVLPLKQGLNKLAFRQKRDADSAELFTLIIKRKGGLPLDLTFQLDEE